MHILPEGKIIRCHHCKKDLYKNRVDFKGGMDVLAADFLPANESVPTPKDGDPMNCPFCNSPITLGGFGMVRGFDTTEGLFSFNKGFYLAEGPEA